MLCHFWGMLGNFWVILGHFGKKKKIKKNDLGRRKKIPQFPKFPNFRSFGPKKHNFPLKKKEKKAQFSTQKFPNFQNFQI